MRFVDSVCVLYMSILVSKWIPWCLRVLNDFCLEGTYWYKISCFVVESAARDLRLAWTDFGPCFLSLVTVFLEAPGQS